MVIYMLTCYVSISSPETGWQGRHIDLIGHCRESESEISERYFLEVTGGHGRRHAHVELNFRCYPFTTTTPTSTTCVMQCGVKVSTCVQMFE